MWFRGRDVKITNGRTRMWVDGDLKGRLNKLITSEACWIRWSIVMSPGGRTSTGETWRLFKTCAGTPDGSWLGNKRWCVTCPSGLWGSTDIFRKFPDHLLRLCLLPQQMWLLPSWSLLCMSFPSNRGVTRSLTTSLGSIHIGTLGGSTVYPILLSSTLLQSLTLSSRDPSTRIFLLTRTDQTSSQSIAGH